MAHGGLTTKAVRLIVTSGPAAIERAVDGEEALAAIERLQPDIVIIDIRMPRLNGIAATTQIKARWPWIRVVAHSLALESGEAALAAGADAFILKGAPTQDLVEALVAAPHHDRKAFRTKQFR